MKEKTVGKVNGLRQALTGVAARAQDRIEKGQPVRALEDAIRRAMDRKVSSAPGFAWVRRNSTGSM